MPFSKRGAGALALAAAAWGCAPIPDTRQPAKSADALAGLGKSLELRAEREPVDAGTDRNGGRLLPAAAVRQAVLHDAGLQAALARVRQAQAEAEQARLLPNPVLTLAFRFPEGGGSADIEGSVSADLLSLLLMPGRISAADGRLRKSTSDAVVALLDIIAGVQRQYAKVQALSARVQIDEARRNILGDLLRITEARLKAGEAARLDVLTVRSESARLDAELQIRRSEQRQAAITLARLVGRPTGSADWQLDPWRPGELPDRSEEEWLKLALQQRPELQSIVWELQALGQDMRVARMGAVVESGEVGPDFERSDGQWAWGPAVAVGIPAFDFGQARRDLVRARIVEQRHELTRAERLVVEQVRVARESLQAARSALAIVDQQLLPIQNDRLEQARNAYRLGAADILAVKLAEQELQQAKSQQIDLQVQVSLAIYDLIRAAGGQAPPSSATQPATSTQPDNANGSAQ